jgi:general secretion pathway protein G
MPAPKHDVLVTLDYASAPRTARSWRDANLVNVFLVVAVVLAVFDLAALFLTPTCMFSTGDRARSDLTRGKIGAMTTPVEIYRQHVGVYPTSLNDLTTRPAGVGSERWEGPYVANSDDLKDAWDQPFRYKAPGVKHPKEYDLWSAGTDGVDGTRDDICNW